MKLGFEESQLSYSSGTQKRSRVDRGLGQRLGLLSALRQYQDVAIPQQQPAGGFLVQVV